MASWPRRISVQGMDIKGPLVRGIPTLTNDSAIVSGIPSGSSGSIHDIIKLYIFDVLSNILSGIYYMTFYLTFFLTFYLTFFWHAIWREFWLSIWQWNLALNLERFWHSIWNAWVQHYSSNLTPTSVGTFSYRTLRAYPTSQLRLVALRKSPANCVYSIAQITICAYLRNVGPKLRDTIHKWPPRLNSRPKDGCAGHSFF